MHKDTLNSVCELINSDAVIAHSVAVFFPNFIWLFVTTAITRHIFITRTSVVPFSIADTTLVCPGAIRILNDLIHPLVGPFGHLEGGIQVPREAQRNKWQ